MIEIMKNNGESQHVKQPVEEKVFYDHENGYDMLYCIWSYLNSILLIIL